MIPRKCGGDAFVDCPVAVDIGHSAAAEIRPYAVAALRDAVANGDLSLRAALLASPLAALPWLWAGSPASTLTDFARSAPEVQRSTEAASRLSHAVGSAHVANALDVAITAASEEEIAAWQGVFRCLASCCHPSLPLPGDVRGHCKPDFDCCLE